ncbi:decaprenylphospho-beta-D-erythro-pentofuranosid-2-ulose 2-reductase [Actinorugispora endophytica]|uniref:Decaprenylphospho-beta-D-erythro-pentofuranosid-2-ulose 2-reductase n=1 Tax=Actinorugispora endophytica TaxID=1605990 RepID=A0A4R6V0M8_9ACTN|nr:decaprenylphospho-beta-D-erythro-pentofuranosid-2-ulose 2-reductase [Actinorugispora endophytica]TDQ52009.1 decaprenylphospho-beta-D-erythro-pentofuranosid-2-ulose 2-reductase [Actinorugispora endophytica]
MRDAVGTVDSVLLLGGRSEIGLAVAARLVRDGARRVVLAARPTGEAGRAALAGAEALLRGAGADEVHVLDFDAAHAATHAGTVEAAVRRVGDLDVVVAAFGVLGDQAGPDADPEAAAAGVTVNLTGHVSAGLAVAARLRAQGHGTLVVLSSVAGVRVRRANLVYGAAKAGLDGFAQGLGDSLAGTGARVLVVRPGYVRTRMSAHVDEAPFATTPARVADAVAAGLRTGAEAVWVPRVLGPVSTAMRLLPRAVWRRLPR